MHLSRILDQIKRHPSPTEALTKLGKAMDKHEDNLLEKGFRILKSELCANVYEAINGPHFDEEHAKYAVEGMENEDGSKGPHWTVEETTSIANQMGINLKSEKHNKWDWYVAMNMIYSDFYKAVVAITGGASTKHFAELTKAWICDKDISEGKMWHYYVYIMCDDEDNDYKAYEHMSHDREYDSDYKYGRERRSSGRMSYPFLDQVIPKINTISVSDSTESTVLGICPKVWCRLPREGVFVLEVRHTPATASATLPVFVSTTGSVSTASNNNNIPVVKGDSTPLVGSEISAGNRYWVYYNKCDNVIQVMNHYTVAAAPAA
jgi:hypothetical protein